MEDLPASCDYYDSQSWLLQRHCVSCHLLTNPHHSSCFHSISTLCLTLVDHPVPCPSMTATGHNCHSVCDLALPQTHTLLLQLPADFHRFMYIQRELVLGSSAGCKTHSRPTSTNGTDNSIAHYVEEWACDFTVTRRTQLCLSFLF